MALNVKNRQVFFLLSLLSCSLILFSLVIGKTAQAHHWFQETHDINTLLTVEVEVIQNRFINPHPFFSAVVIDSLDQAIDKYGDVSKDWQLQMDNRRELEELGFDTKTLLPGDKIIVSAHPGSTRKNIFYVKALEHPRLGFRYEHNVRQLIKLP